MAVKKTRKTELHVSTDLTTGNLVKIAQVKNLVPPSYEAQTEDSSDLDSDHDTFEFTSYGWKELSGTLNFDEELAGHDALIDEATGPTGKRAMRIVFVSGAYWDFIGGFTKIAPKGGDRTSLQELDFSIAISGNITPTAA